MIILLNTQVQYQCDAIRINLMPHKYADDSCSVAQIAEIVQVARRMGSYIALIKNGMVERLIDPNTILSIVPNTLDKTGDLQSNYAESANFG